MSKKPLSAEDIARRRIIERIDLSYRKGVVVANGKRFTVKFDDVLDLAQAVEMIMLKVTRKMLVATFRPEIVDREALTHDNLIAGDYSLCDGASPMPPLQRCDITGEIMRTHYMRISFEGVYWDTWFCRLDELVKALYEIIGDRQKPEERLPAHLIGPAHHAHMVH